MQLSQLLKSKLHYARVTYANPDYVGSIEVDGTNCGAAHFFNPDDRLIIASFALTDEPIDPKVLLLDEENKVVKQLEPFTVLG